ncbi:hypothetical protein Q0M94_26550 (plasmid) [Deinococcus radiomollis]|uniref:hypothetical protein n=1 Tax=Deinococcus radiomollis TaxID=468916 RepID=UPI0038914722
MSSKFNALGKLNARKPGTEEGRKLDSEKVIIPETEERWEALGTEVRRTTKRRLKAYAGANGRKLKELVDEAILAHLDKLEN